MMSDSLKVCYEEVEMSDYPLEDVKGLGLRMRALATSLHQNGTILLEHLYSQLWI